jgi:hypothetical protein
MTHQKFNPLAAWGVFFCGCGGIWTLITWLQFFGEVNKATGRNTAQAWTILIPIFHGLELSKVIAEVNGLIDQHGVETEKVNDNMVLNILFYLIPFYSLLKAWGAIADKLNAQSA